MYIINGAVEHSKITGGARCGHDVFKIYRLGWKFSRAIWSYCDVMVTRRKPDPEKNILSCAKCNIRTMVYIGFTMLQNPRRKHALESKIHRQYFMQGAVEIFRSWSQAEYLSFLLCGKTCLKLEIYWFGVRDDTILVFSCDCVAVLHPIERDGPLLNNISLIHLQRHSKLYFHQKRCLLWTANSQYLL